MKPAEAEKLLGGYAAGTLTEVERQGLFAAALEHQEVFDALADEEVLRDLLADPAARAQLLAALSAVAEPRSAAALRVVPFWRRTGVLGAAASLLVAATAGLAYLRSPDKVPPPLASPKVSALKVQEAPAPSASSAAPAPVTQKRSVEDRTLRQDKGIAPRSAPPQAAAPGVAAVLQEDLAHRKEPSEGREAKKTLAPKPTSAPVMEVVASKEETSHQANQASVTRLADLPPARSTEAMAGLASGAVAPAPAAMAKAKADHRPADAASRGAAPVRWSLKAQPDGSTAVEVWASREAQLVLLKRGPGGVAMVPLLPKVATGASTETIPWRCEVRLGAEDVLDLYRLNHPVGDPLKLPESGPFEGFRARIHPGR